MGKTPSRKNPAYWIDGNADWVSIADLGLFDKYVGRTKERINDLAIEESGIKPAPANTVIMSFKLSLGKTAITTAETYTNEAIMAFIDKGAYWINPEYFYHQFRTRNWMEETNHAVMGATLNKATISESLIKIPDAAEQNEVVRQLNQVCSLIALANRRLYKLDELVKSRFIEMFGDWKKFQQAPLLDCVNSIDSGKSPKCSPISRMGRQPAVLKLSAISSGTYQERENKALLPGEAIVQDKEVAAEDILMTRKNTPELVGMCVLVRETQGNIMFPDLVFRMHPVDTVDGTYLSNLLSGPLFTKVREMAHGSAKSMSNIPKSELEKLVIPIPPIELQQQFADFVQQVDKLEFETQQAIDKLQLLYDSLAQEYFAE